MDNQKANWVNKKMGIGVICLVICLAVSIFVLFLHFGNGNSALQDKLMQDWWRFDEINDMFCVLILDFSENEVNIVASDLDKETVIDTLDIETVSENQFLIKDYDIVFTVEFSEDGEQMTVSPGLTSTDLDENWTVMARPYGTEE